MRLLFSILFLGFVALGTSVRGWESSLYDDSWVPDPNLFFESDKVVQDFSYAGYMRGEELAPDIVGPVFDVVSGYGADPTGTVDSTTEIQNAIDAASSAGGGVVYLPAGTYLVEPPSGESVALKVSGSNVVLRGAGKGQTFLLNASYQMRSKRVVEFAGPTPYWGWNSGTAYTITEDLLTPGFRVPLADVSAFSVGDWVVIRMDVTTDWVNEHNEPGWLGFEASLGGLRYSRQVMEVDTMNNELILDAPLRYALKMRDNARVYIRNNALEGVGIEDLSIGNVQHPGSNWGESDYTDSGKSAYDTHASYLIQMRNARNSWIRRVDSFQAAGNTTTTHMLSNGILLSECRGVTVEECHLQRPQYGGGGGNGYMYRLSHSNECLVRDCIAEFNRHGFVFSHMGSSGNVYHNCRDKNTGKATGSTGSYNTSGKASDHHMQFSHSNLIDVCIADNSWFTAHYRPYGTDPKHNLTSAHSVFWNTEGVSSPIGKVVHSQQAKYGYVIGTRGAVTAVETGGTSTEKTAPVDHVEGVGSGDTLDPYSLYRDQLRRRLFLPRIESGEERYFTFPVNRVPLDAVVLFGDSASVPAMGEIEWSQVEGPGVARIGSGFAAVPLPGTYRFRCTARNTSYTISEAETSEVFTIHVLAPDRKREALEPIADGYVRGGAANENDNFGSANSLWMKNDGGEAVEREFYLKWDLSSWAGYTAESINIELHADSSETDCDAELFLASDGWTEGSLTWASKPSLVQSLEFWSPSPSMKQMFEVTSVVSSEVGGDGFFSVGSRVLSQVSSGTIYRYHSREASDSGLRPVLSGQFQNGGAVPFSTWVDSFSGLAANEKDPDSDPESDGVFHLAEKFHLLSPEEVDGFPIVLDRDGEGLFVEFVLNEDLPVDTWMRAEFSSDPATVPWSIDEEARYEPGAQPGRFRLRLPSSVESGPDTAMRMVYRLGSEEYFLPVPLRAGVVPFSVTRAGVDVEVSWDPNLAATVQIFRGTTGEFGEAALLGDSSSGKFVDDSGDPSVELYYWVRAVSTVAIPEPVSAMQSVAALRSRPDLSVGKSLSSLRGNNQYGGRQQVKVASKRGARAFLGIQSDGLPEAVRLHGTRGNRLLRVTYVSASPPAGNITGTVVRGAYRTPVLSGTGRAVGVIKVRRLKKERSFRKKLRVSGVSATNGAVADGVIFFYKAK